MSVGSTVLNGNPVPRVELGFLEQDRVSAVATGTLFARGKTLAIGIPGAFTPVCTTRHLPDFLLNVERVRDAGYTQLLCIAPNDPFVLDAWVRTVDPEGKIRFLSDGTLDFAEALGVVDVDRKSFLGRRSKRYLLAVENGVIVRLKVENSIYECSVTKPSAALADDELSLASA